MGMATGLTGANEMLVDVTKAQAFIVPVWFRPESCHLL